MRYRTILLFGAPGSGKGTQGQIIGSIPGFQHSSTGDIFRSLDLHTEMGRKFWEYSSRGQLVPDELTIQLWKQYIKGLEYINQFHPESEFLVLDGLPRNVHQKVLLEDVIDVQAIVYLRAERDKMVERLRRRALKENRFDDASDEVINKRMDVFGRETRPVLDLYPQELIHRIDATMSQIRILSEIVTRVLVPLKEAVERPADESLASLQGP
ncbi:adenylate kinase family protein [Humisphaera borealis]|uniref:Adenylate kinase n=1 Tax=Humisphaera borealis TaxID=2807512 RepID=A0A7M2WTX2_9BACT|nr:nucleoside monophosphate kinase [Humisphaera borealis]QOV88899.1 nucleoside monophosphate kinase [Humisphaera borealis]